MDENVKSRGQEIAEDDAFEVLHCDDKAPAVCQSTDAEICSMVLMNSNTSGTTQSGGVMIKVGCAAGGHGTADTSRDDCTLGIPSDHFHTGLMSIVHS
ncbi:hypothetical protein AVEN_121608-1 [Araneus ventricosus]|uniref:Uncharacterized protein n=1 Tax=Araneus ventricosus TaxID=182803 RepID=A0A4Y2QV48_ARAVE|nr:hypothetical protein AVEN_121608-1 [Araneus ventricosus]